MTIISFSSEELLYGVIETRSITSNVNLSEVEPAQNMLNIILIVPVKYW